MEIEREGMRFTIKRGNQITHIHAEDANIIREAVYDDLMRDLAEEFQNLDLLEKEQAIIRIMKN